MHSAVVCTCRYHSLLYGFLLKALRLREARDLETEEAVKNKLLRSESEKTKVCVCACVCVGGADFGSGLLI